MRAAKLAAAAEALKRQSAARAPFSLAFLTDRRRIAHPLVIARVLPPGAAVVLRDYDMPRRAGLAARLKSVCEARALKLIIGADLALAEKVGADGVHYPRWFSSDRRPPETMIVTAAAHNAAELHHAAELGANLAFLSPVFETRSHPDGQALGAGAFLSLAKAAALPVLALGGVDEVNAPLLAHPNICGIGAIGAFKG